MSSFDIIPHTSPNNGARFGHKPDMICCHCTDAPIGSVVNWFMNPDSEVSAHFAVSKAGKIHSFVPLERAAWCNGTNTTDPAAHNHYSRALSELVRQRRTNANFYTVSIEFEDWETGDLTEKQYQAGLWLMRFIAEKMKVLFGVDFSADREHIIGHYEVNPYSKASCPGKDFPFERFISDLNSSPEEPSLPEEPPQENPEVPSSGETSEPEGGKTPETDTGHEDGQQPLPETPGTPDGETWDNPQPGEETEDGDRTPTDPEIPTEDDTTVPPTEEPEQPSIDISPVPVKKESLLMRIFSAGIRALISLFRKK